jgi:hypothetical protein
MAAKDKSSWRRSRGWRRLPAWDGLERGKWNPAQPSKPINVSKNTSFQHPTVFFPLSCLPSARFGPPTFFSRSVTDHNRSFPSVSSHALLPPNGGYASLSSTSLFYLVLHHFVVPLFHAKSVPLSHVSRGYSPLPDIVVLLPYCIATYSLLHFITLQSTPVSNRPFAHHLWSTPGSNRSSSHMPCAAHHRPASYQSG